jgi:hypothetical protein
VFSGSYRLDVAVRRSCSLSNVSINWLPLSVKLPVLVFSSNSKSLTSSCGIRELTFVYSSDLSLVGPEMINGVLASSISILSTSSTIA